MGTILGKGFPQVQLHTELTAWVPISAMHKCLWKTLSQNYVPMHGQMTFSNSICFYNVSFCFTTYAQQKKSSNSMSTMEEWHTTISFPHSRQIYTMGQWDLMISFPHSRLHKAIWQIFLFENLFTMVTLLILLFGNEYSNWNS